MSNIPFVFLDSAVTDAQNKNSYLFANPVEILTAYTTSEVKLIFEKIDQLSNKFWIAGFISYETLYAFHPKIKHKKISATPLLWLGVFKTPKKYNPNITTNLLNSTKFELSNDISFNEYNRTFSKIKKYLFNGYTYQVNYTFDCILKTNLNGLTLYQHLRQKQPTAYCAYIDTGKNQIMSFSPELFFRRENRIITAKPMKGTISRGRSFADDKQAKNILTNDIKNRAENLMIVDLLRNDLGKICDTGTVKVKNMFKLESHPTLHQMTSTIEGCLKRKIRYHDIFASLFPCGSVTGAPKLKTMQIIQKIENGQRGVYCGAIGYISPKNKAVFNVPIRTLEKNNSQQNWKLRVGSGIVWDSDPKKEWEECLLKSSFVVNTKLSKFEIFETIRIKNKKFTYLSNHLRRLRASCEYFKYPYSTQKINAIIKNMTANIDNGLCAVRIIINADGCINWDKRSISDTISSAKIVIAEQRLDRNNIFLFHKTTYRPWYSALFNSDKTEIFDYIFLNEYDEVCEGSRTNIFAQINGKLYTPPITCGLLPGILRQRLIQQGKCKERILTLKDLKKAKAIYCGNSVRGLVKVKL
ncbi:MAG: aminodeoxychorismate synthase component I [Candidatus Omnitrophica bacterium]|nr:aminodeoxychorismate synthase component I [Candidatus Omnitrophota bacterium]